MLIPEDQIWMIVVGFIVAFVLAFGIGANDVANSFGTSVGSKVLTLKQACTLATICELAGAILLGAKVSNTIRKGIVNIDLFADLQNGPSVLMAGQVAALGGSCIWLLVATFFRLPVSGTHSIVGATMGFSLVIFGFRSIRWEGVLKIVASWFLSPLLSGISSVGMFYLVRFLVLSKESQMEPALRMLPGFYGTVVLVNMFSIFYEGPQMLHFDRIPIYGVFILSASCGVITVVVVKFLWVPRLRNRIVAASNSRQTWQDNLSQQTRPTRLKFVSRRFTGCHLEANSESNQSERPDIFVIENIPEDSQENNAIELEEYGTISKNNHSTEREENLHESSNMYTNQSKKVRKKFRWISLSSKAIHRVFTVQRVGKPNSLGLPDDRPVGVASNCNVDSSDQISSFSRPDTVNEDYETKEKSNNVHVEGRVFAFLQIITAVFGSFAHGGNDVSNAIGPLIGLWIVGLTQTVSSKMSTPIWILVYGGLGISVGLWIWGRRVIQTIGEDLTQITPSTGVCIELGSALTVLIASKIGLPISTTHCKVGSVVGVGQARSRDSVNWSVFRNILLAWIVTLPAAGALSALLMYCFTFLV